MSDSECVECCLRGTRKGGVRGAGGTLYTELTRVEFSTRSRQIEDSRGLALVIAQPYTTLAK